MTTGFGIDPTLDGSGVPTSGTSSLDIRHISAGLYSPGVISGGVVSTSVSSLTYAVSAGVAAVSIAAGETTLVPVPAVTVTTTAPSSGSRTDIIYIQQHVPSIDGDSNAIVGVASALPPRSLMLDSYVISAGQSNTRQAVKNGNIDYSIPYGASLGVIYQYRDVLNGPIGADTTIVNASFYLPTDRLVHLSMLASMNSEGATGFDNSKYCEAGFYTYMDGVERWAWTTPGLHQARAEYHWADYCTLTAGKHTVSVRRTIATGPATPWQHWEPNGTPGALFTIQDIGPVIY